VANSEINLLFCLSIQSKSLPANLLLLVGGFETQLGEQVRLTICGTV